MKRKFEAVLSILLKCLFLYDPLYLFLIKPVERLLFRRLSSSLIISSGNDLHMSFDFQELLALRRKKSTVQKLLKIKRSFLSGLEKLNFNEGQKYYTNVNEVFYFILTRDKKMKERGILSHIISSEEKNQAETKLSLIKSTDVWKELISKNRRRYLNFLFRKEKILRIELMKSSGRNRIF